jgi:hypothetical protein
MLAKVDHIARAKISTSEYATIPPHLHKLTDSLWEAALLE